MFGCRGIGAKWTESEFPRTGALYVDMFKVPAIELCAFPNNFAFRNWITLFSVQVMLWPHGMEANRVSVRDIEGYIDALAECFSSVPDKQAIQLGPYRFKPGQVSVLFDRNFDL